MITIFGDHIPEVGETFITNKETDSGLTYIILPSTNGVSIRFKRSDGGVGNWNQKKFNEYINDNRLILVQDANHTR